MNASLSVLPPLVAIAIAIWSRKILPSLLIGLLAGSYFLHPTVTSGFATAVDQIVKTLTDKDNLQVLLFLYLFSGLIGIVKRSGGIKPFSDKADKHSKIERVVFFTLWALIPVTFIDCGFRIVGAGSITRSLAKKHKIATERLAFMLNNTASPVVELIPIATTYVGFNVAIITQGLKGVKITEGNSAYTIWLKAISLEFFSIAVILITFLSIFAQFKTADHKPEAPHGGKPEMSMNMEDPEPVITPRVINLIVPMTSVTLLCFFFFWLFGREKSGSFSTASAITNTKPNRAMLVALFILIALNAIFYVSQKYNLKQLTADVMSGGNEIINTLAILAIAWPLASVLQELELNGLIQQQLGSCLPA